tara:strand:- start:2083 stop:2349 length:267 start_codon:yes stop_codon:yes gene_type:complete
MFVLALEGREKEGLYSADNEDGDRVLYIFREEDDADRFVGLLEADDFPTLSVIEVDEEATLAICEANNYTYAIIEENDLIIPPRVTDD